MRTVRRNYINISLLNPIFSLILTPAFKVAFVIDIERDDFALNRTVNGNEIKNERKFVVYID